MAVPEGASEGVNLWQGLGSAAAVFVAVGSAIVLRILGKKNDTETAGDAGKHVVLQEATLAESGPFVRMAADISAIRTLLEEQVEEQKERRENEQREAVKDEVDRLRRDAESMRAMMDELRRSAGPYTTAPRRKTE